MKKELKKQSISHGGYLISKTVRGITTWKGRTVGVIRKALGVGVSGSLELVVEQVGTRWGVLDGVSVDDIRQEQV